MSVTVYVVTERYKLVVSKPRFRRFWKSLGLSDSRYSIRLKSMCLVMCWPDVDVLVFCIDGSSSKSN